MCDTYQRRLGNKWYTCQIMLLDKGLSWRLKGSPDRYKSSLMMHCIIKDEVILHELDAHAADKLYITKQDVLDFCADSK